MHGKIPKENEEVPNKQSDKNIKALLSKSKNNSSTTMKKNILNNLVKLPSNNKKNVESNLTTTSNRDVEETVKKPVNGLQLLGSYSDSESE